MILKNISKYIFYLGVNSPFFYFALFLTPSVKKWHPKAKELQADYCSDSFGVSHGSTLGPLTAQKPINMCMR